jgi:hypothetical protein
MVGAEGLGSQRGTGRSSAITTSKDGTNCARTIKLKTRTSKLRHEARGGWHQRNPLTSPSPCVLGWLRSSAYRWSLPVPVITKVPDHAPPFCLTARAGTLARAA